MFDTDVYDSKFGVKGKVLAYNAKKAKLLVVHNPLITKIIILVFQGREEG